MAEERKTKQSEVLGLLVRKGRELYKQIISNHKELGQEMCISQMNIWVNTTTKIMEELKLPEYYITKFVHIPKTAMCYANMNMNVGQELDRLERRITYLADIQEKLDADDTKTINYNLIVQLDSIVKNNLNMSLLGLPGLSN